MMLFAARVTTKTTAPATLTNKLVQGVLFLFRLVLHIAGATAELTCHECVGISCLRSSYEATQSCLNHLDICVNIFDGQTLLAQGCWEQLPEEFRYKCESDGILRNSNELSGCFKCNENLCNKMSSSSFECIQCDSESDTNCLTNPLSLAPSRCGISRTPNQYCFAKRDGVSVIRGCAYNLQEQMSCLSSANCMICQPSELSSCNNIEMEMDESGSDGEHSEDERPEGDSEQRNGRVCHQCSGINCLRASYAATQKCLSNTDICVTVFDDEAVLGQGCWEQLSEELREKCNDAAQCFKCHESLCNRFASESFECIQCDSNNDETCRTNSLGLVPTRCNISRTPNEYCYVKQKGDRVIRGCSYTLEEQISCLSNDNCMICLPGEIRGCNNIEVVEMDISDGSHGDASVNEGSDNDSDNGSSNGGNSDGDNTEEIPSKGEDNDVNGNLSTEGSTVSTEGSSESGNDGDNSLNGCTSISSSIIIVLPSIVFVLFYSITQD